MTVQETNKTIAEYMGLTEDEYPSNLPPGTEVCGNFMDNEIHYHDRIDWLYPVARKVKEELEDVLTKNRNDDEALDCYIKLEDAATTFELYLLYEVVCNVIEFLNKHKEG